MDMIFEIGRELKKDREQVAAVVQLLEQGATIPFIARYRKERTGSLDEVAVTAIRDRLEQLTALEARKTAIIQSLTQRGLLTGDLSRDILAASSMAGLEDLYEKYRPKKTTRAGEAREKGLDPLAQQLLGQYPDFDPLIKAQGFVDPEKGVASADDALAGARDIIAETVNEDVEIRARIRDLFMKEARIQSAARKGREEEGQKFKDYFDWSEPAFKAPSHRILAMFRGHGEGVLRVRVLPDEEKALSVIDQKYVRNGSASAREVRVAVRDGYRRLLSRSMEKECMSALKNVADETAIAVFASNLRELLLSPPLGRKKILAIDPGFRTGCKVVCLDAQGDLVHHEVIFLHEPHVQKAGETVKRLVRTHGTQAVAVGNGTAGRETEAFVKGLGLDADIPVIMVDESGASVYSASESARREFPDQDITVRGAVSIGRRLMDPLAELVKLDPKSIGVGQYQHDVDQKLLQKTLDDVVVSCVNQVGVEVNTASRELLARVSGLNDAVAAGIIRFRNENGPFRSRKAFLKVPRLGPKTFEQAAGFLRIHDGDHPLDRTGIHPESYGVATRMAGDLNMGIEDLMMNREVLNRIVPDSYVTGSVGLPTLKDIVRELSNPGRDPRKQFQVFSFDSGIHDIMDLAPGMRVPGIVTNVTAFGAFVDIGVHQDGLVHISQMADRFIKDPREIVTVRQTVMVTVLEVDVKRKRIALSMKKA